MKEATKKPKRGLTLTGPAIHELVLGNASTRANNSLKYLVLMLTSLPFVTEMRIRVIKSINFCVNENPKDLAIVRYGYIGSVRGIGKSIS